MRWRRCVFCWCILIKGCWYWWMRLRSSWKGMIWSWKWMWWRRWWCFFLMVKFCWFCLLLLCGMCCFWRIIWYKSFYFCIWRLLIRWMLRVRFFWKWFLFVRIFEIICSIWMSIFVVWCCGFLCGWRKWSLLSFWFCLFWLIWSIVMCLCDGMLFW